MSEARSRRVWLPVLLPLILAATLAARTTTRESCTVDEFGNLPLAVAYWKPGALHIDPGNPPLTRWIQGAAMFAPTVELGSTRAELDSIRTSWDLGYRFEAAHRSDYHELLVRARLGSVALFLATVLGVYILARETAGARPALAAALLTAACPNLLAHGRLVTPDIGLACFTVWGVRAARRARQTAALGPAVTAGLLTAAAILSKFSGLVLVPVLAMAIAGGSSGRRPARLGAYLAAALAPLYIAYGFPPPGLLHGWPTPLPSSIVRGIEAQLAEAPYPAYLLGELREGGGWAHYHLVAFLVKTPLPVIALLVWAGVAIVRARRKEFALPLVAAALFLLAFGAATRKNVGLRYVLPVLPLLHVVAAGAFGRRPVGPWILTGLAVAFGISASAAPIASFNGVEKLWGGKRAVLVDSNLDWGQALPDLRDWQKRHGIETVQLAYFGRVDPSIYGIRWRTLPSKPVRGAVAISATFAVGRPYAVLMKERPFLEPIRAWSAPDTWKWLEGLPPDEELGGGAILVWKDIGDAWDLKKGEKRRGRARKRARAVRQAWRTGRTGAT